LELTFINTAGFMLKSGDYKVLIDGLFDGVPSRYKPPTIFLQEAIAGLPPYDGIDLLLFTHDHSDHFSSRLVLQFLLNNPETVLASTPDVVDALLRLDEDLQERLTAVQLGAGDTLEIEAAGISLEAIPISHGIPDYLNLGFIIDLPGGRVFHSGDLAVEHNSLSELQSLGLPSKNLALALLPVFMFEDQAFHTQIREGIGARYVIPMHHSYLEPPEGIEADFPQSFVFTDTLERWELPHGDSSVSAPGRTVSFTTQDGVELSGTLFGTGETAVILAHMGAHGADQTNWWDFAQVLAEAGFSALAFDFRGFGVSSGMRDGTRLGYDTSAAVNYLLDQGYEKIACVGASMGGTACTLAALNQGLSGLVVFASTMSLDRLGQTAALEESDLANLQIPKLYLTASGDSPKVVYDMKRMYEVSAEPKTLQVFEGFSEHGTDLFGTEAGDELEEVLLGFLMGLE
jgi:L-ascorbate metabolism protein UlaG (beta-lactamase superfamily)/alpha/beta superfamily hydrolase